MRVPRITSAKQIGRTTSEYRCARCGSFHALRLKAIGILAYLAAAPAFALVLVSAAPELGARVGAWLGRVAYRPVQTGA